MKQHRRHRVAKSENDRVYIIENNSTQDHSKIRRLAWKFIKRTWKALKTGFKSTVNSQLYCVALEPTAIATTIVEYQTQRREYR